MKISAPVGSTASGKRSFSLGYRLEFLAAWDQCEAHGDKARLLRANGLSRDTVKRWLRARDEGLLDESAVQAMSGNRRRTHSEDRSELLRLRRENERLQNKVREAEAVQEIMGKAFELLEGITKSSTGPQAQIPPSLMSAREYEHWLERKRW